MLLYNREPLEFLRGNRNREHGAASTGDVLDLYRELDEVVCKCYSYASLQMLAF